MKTPIRYYKAAVNSGQWLLFRRVHRRLKNGQNPLQLDSDPPSAYNKTRRILIHGATIQFIVQWNFQKMKIY
ncbi:hypothetical protein A9Q87_12725 [Flavobacteriales bacterium 34_180_T64]|nr:hypothetical protein A9Q87_12725 [Flavobacteriales bacterium 34_180_T64]